MAHARQPQPQGLGSPHILASPPGVAAPINAINYTPKTGEVHQPGAMAPVHELNYSLMPQGTVGDRPQGMGNGNQGMGAGVGPVGQSPVIPGQEHITGRYSPGASMATGSQSPGQPPLRQSPYSTGPGPRSAPTGPASAAFGNRSSMRGTAQGWGMGNEMGAGAQGDTDQYGDPTDPSDISDLNAYVNSLGLLDTSDSSAGGDGGVQSSPSGAPSSDPSATAPVQAPAGWTHPDTSTMAVGDYVWYTSPDGKTRRPLGYITGIDPATSQRRVTQVPLADQQAILQAEGTPDPTKGTPHYQNIRNPDTNQNEIWLMNPDGTPNHVIGLSSSQPTAKAAPKPPANVGDVKRLGNSNMVFKKDASGNWVYDPELSAQYAAQSGNKASSTVSASVAAAAIRAKSAAATAKIWSVQTDPSTGGLIGVNLNDPTGSSGVVKLTGVDPTHGLYNAGGTILKLSDDGTTATPIYTAPPNWTTTTIAGETIAYDPQDPTKRISLGSDPTYLPQAAATLEQTKTNTQSIMQAVLNGQITAESARETLMENVQKMLHPPVEFSGGNYIMRPGSGDLILNYGSVQGGPQRGSQTITGQPVDPDAQKIADQVNAFFTDYDKRQASLNSNFDQRVAAQDKNAPSPYGQTQAAQPKPADASQANVSQAVAQSQQNTLPAGQAGVPGQDPRFQDAAQPPHNVTTAMGDIAHYDAGGMLSGITYLNTAPPHYGEPGYPGSEGYDDSLSVGVEATDGTGDTTDSGIGDYGGIGMGQESFDGRGLMPRTGRGSTGVGWNPKQGAGHMSNYWQPKGYGTGGESGMGAGGVYVRSPDGSMHWDETKADPNPNGGSVIDSSSGKAIPGANSQSGPTGPGGTGPPGSQARAAHIQELAQNPTFASGTSGQLNMMSGASPAQLAGASYAQATGGQGYQGYPGGSTVGNTLANATNPWVNPQISPMNIVNNQVSPFNTQPLLTPSAMNVKTALGQSPNSLPVTQPGQRTPAQLGIGGGQEAYGAGQGSMDPILQRAMQRRQQMGMGSGQGPLPTPGGAGPVQPGGPAGPQPGWTPPVPQGDVAGIGHRFGQAMDQGEPQHSGVDLQATEGTPTVSPVDGMVERVEQNPQGLGLTVIIRGKDGSEHRLGHLSHTDAYPGMLVSQGQDLQSKVGSTGNTTGSHLHWGVRDPSGQPVDPTGALPPGMQNMPPVPGTQMMGPPGGNGGAAQAGGGMPPGMGNGQDTYPKGLASDGNELPGAGADLSSTVPMQGQGIGSQSPDYQRGYQDGVASSKSPGTPPLFVPSMQQPIPSMADDQQQQQGDPGQMGGGAEDDPGDEPEWINPGGWDPLEVQRQGPVRGSNPQRMPRIPRVMPGQDIHNSTMQPGDYGDEYDVAKNLPPQVQFGHTGGWTPRDPLTDELQGFTPGLWRRMRRGDVDPGNLGTGQDSADTRWDLYEAKDTQGFMGPGAGTEMGAGATVAGVDPATQENNDTSVQIATMNNQEALAAATMQYNVATAQVNANIAAENNRHAEALSQLQQNFAFHQDEVALQQEQDAETQRHNQAIEGLQAQQTQMQQTLEQMKEASAVQIETMQEGAQIKLQQGQQAFQDWQARQQDRMSILSSALNNPWLQQLAGMAPAPGVTGGVTGGMNLANLIQSVLQPYDPNAPGGQGGGPQMFTSGAPQIQTPTWSQWQGWSPFQMAAYRTNIEALGPGVWNQVQSGLESGFSAQGGSPNVTQMQAAAATPEQSAGQQMTANAFGQTVPEWQQNQQKQWSQSQAPKVQSAMTSTPQGLAA